MKRLTVIFTVSTMVILLIGGAGLTQEKRQSDVTKDLLVSHITALRNQELRVAILQQLLNEETLKLSQMQAIFSDQYKLDPDKLRAGLYQYDEKTSQFVERKIEVDTAGTGITGISPNSGGKQQ